MRFEALRVGELARRTGLTIRTLHHYDEIGLLKPSQHSEAGYRLYTAGDVARLQQVLSLRQLGFSLEEVRDCLDRPGFSPLESIRLHIGRLREQVEMQRELCEKLEAIAAHFRAAEEVSADEFLKVIERMTMIESYYTPEQLESIKARGEQMGAEAIRQSQVDWAELIAEVRAEEEKGTDPTDPKVLAMASSFSQSSRCISTRSRSRPMWRRMHSSGEKPGRSRQSRTSSRENPSCLSERTCWSRPTSPDV